MNINTNIFHLFQDAILSDELNHASIIDGIRLCKSKKYRYKHKDMNDLERMLADSQVLTNHSSVFIDQSQFRIVAVD